MGTRIDIKIPNQDTVTFAGVPIVTLVQHGFFGLDKVNGKTLARIEIKIPSSGEVIDFIPEEVFIEELLDKFLEAEFRNDNFIFTNPVLKEKRNPQLNKKLKRFFDVIYKWAEKNGNNKIQEKVRQLSLWDSANSQ